MFKKIHKRRDAPGGQVFPDKPLCTVPVETLGGMTDSRKMNTCFVEEKTKSTETVSEGQDMFMYVNKPAFIS